MPSFQGWAAPHSPTLIIWGIFSCCHAIGSPSSGRAFKSPLRARTNGASGVFLSDVESGKAGGYVWWVTLARPHGWMRCIPPQPSLQLTDNPSARMQLCSTAQQLGAHWGSLGRGCKQEDKAMPLTLLQGDGGRERLLCLGLKRCMHLSKFAYPIYSLHLSQHWDALHTNRGHGYVPSISHLPGTWEKTLNGATDPWNLRE